MRLALAGTCAAALLIASAAAAQTAPPVDDQRPPDKPQLADEPVQADGPAAPAPAPDTRPPDRPAVAEPVDAVTPADPATKPIGKLIPPEAAVEPPAAPMEPPGPPIRQTLRESDFDHSACLLALHELGTVFETGKPITEPGQRDCGIARPVHVTEILPGVTLQGGAYMRCGTARALGTWVRDFVRPAAAILPDAPRLTELQLGTTYDCRGRVGGEAGAKLSEHAFGNGIDISAFAFQGGDPIPVEPRQDSGDLVEAFQRSVRGAACLYFTTVLGPGSNSSHNDHLHLDIAARKNGWRLCQ